MPCIAVLAGFSVLTACDQDQTTAPGARQVPSLTVSLNRVEGTTTDEEGVAAQLIGITNAGMYYNSDLGHYEGRGESSTYRTGSLKYMVHTDAKVQANGLTDIKSCNGFSECTATAAVQVPECSGSTTITITANGTHELRHVLTPDIFGPFNTKDISSRC